MKLVLPFHFTWVPGMSCGLPACTASVPRLTEPPVWPTPTIFIWILEIELGSSGLQGNYYVSHSLALKDEF